jgi:hypothetical protein
MQFANMKGGGTPPSTADSLLQLYALHFAGHFRVVYKRFSHQPVVRRFCVFTLIKIYIATLNLLLANGTFRACINKAEKYAFIIFYEYCKLPYVYRREVY